MPYKVEKLVKAGSTVTIRTKKWYDHHKDCGGSVTNVPFHFTEGMAQYCGKQAKVVGTDPKPSCGVGTAFTLDIDGGRYMWSAPMFVVPRKHNLSRL